MKEDPEFHSFYLRESELIFNRLEDNLTPPPTPPPAKTELLRQEYLITIGEGSSEMKGHGFKKGDSVQGKAYDADEVRQGELVGIIDKEEYEGTRITRFDKADANHFWVWAIGKRWRYKRSATIVLFATHHIARLDEDTPESGQSVRIHIGDDGACFLGLAAGYSVVADHTSTLRAGDIAALQTEELHAENVFAIGRVVSVSKSEITIKERRDKEVTYPRHDLTWTGLVDLASQEKSDPLSREDRERVDALRARLTEMNTDEITSCTAAMKIERKLYDIEHPTDSDPDDWSAWEED